MPYFYYVINITKGAYNSYTQMTSGNGLNELFLTKKVTKRFDCSIGFACCIFSAVLVLNRIMPDFVTEGISVYLLFVYIRGHYAF